MTVDRADPADPAEVSARAEASAAATSRTPLVAAIVAATTMLALAVVRIGRSFGYDEAITYAFFVNGGSVRRALTTQVVFNNHPVFSASQAVLWRLGLTGETPQRLAPALCAAVTVGAVVWFTTKRSNLVGGAASAVVLILNVMFLDYARQLRGYALATCAVVLAAFAIHRSWSDRRVRWLVAQGVCMTVAVATHSYSAVTLAALATAALILGKVERRHLVTWTAAALATLVILWPLLDDLRANAELRGNRYLSWFGETLLRSLTAESTAIALLIGGLAAVGVWALADGDRRTLAAALGGIAVIAVVVILLWQVVQPWDLYPRFFISVLPFLAILVGLGVARLPTLAAVPVVAILAIALVPPAVDRFDRVPTIRDAAAVADRARAEGLFVCGFQVEPLLVYTAPMPMLSGLDGFGDCDVYINVLGVSADRRAAADDRYGGSRSLGGGIIVWAEQPALDRLVDGGG